VPIRPKLPKTCFQTVKRQESSLYRAACYCMFHPVVWLATAVILHWNPSECAAIGHINLNATVVRCPGNMHGSHERQKKQKERSLSQKCYVAQMRGSPNSRDESQAIFCPTSNVLCLVASRNGYAVVSCRSLRIIRGHRCCFPRAGSSTPDVLIWFT
jgi:hypothetical protein